MTDAVTKIRGEERRLKGASSDREQLPQWVCRGGDGRRRPACQAGSTKASRGVDGLGRGVWQQLSPFCCCYCGLWTRE